MRAVLLLSVLIVASLAAGCSEDGDGGRGGGNAASYACDAAPSAPDAEWKAEKPRVRFNTSKGSFVAQLDREAAPITVGNFLNLTEDGFFDGTLFHRIVRGFVIQGGDPLSKDANPANDGTGDPGYEIPDEFNPALRHAAAGVLSMANSGPDSGGSQFFVTLAPTRPLDDRHSVFGNVTEGLDVVQAIGAVATNRDRPVEDVVLEKVTLMDPLPFEARHEVVVHPVIPRKDVAAGRDATFAVTLMNKGNTRDRITLTANVPPGWECRVDDTPVVPAGTGRVVLLTLTPPGDFEGEARVPLAAASAWPGAPNATSQIHLKQVVFGEPVREGDTVTANYAGVLTDGRLFDSSMAPIARHPLQPKFTTEGGFRDRGNEGYKPFTFTVGRGVIEGFTELALTAKVGETVAARIPSAKAYAYVPGASDVYQDPLTGRDLVFELEILNAKR